MTVVVDQRHRLPADAHVRDLPLFDYREALRPSTRLGRPAKRNTKSRSSRSLATLHRSSRPRPASFNARSRETNLAVRLRRSSSPSDEGVEDRPIDAKQKRLRSATGIYGRSYRC